MSMTNNDKKAAELVKKTEIWPNEAPLPGSMGIKNNSTDKLLTLLQNTIYSEFV